MTTCIYEACFSSTQTHSWMPLKKDPNSPNMPRNSTRLKFFTINSSHTLDIPYSIAPPRTSRFPNSFCSPGKIQEEREEESTLTNDQETPTNSQHPHMHAPLVGHNNALFIISNYQWICALMSCLQSNVNLLSVIF